MAHGTETWTVTERRELADYRIFKAAELRSLGPHGKEGRFVILDAPDWAVVVPVVVREGGRFILSVRQYRHGSGVVSAEFPGGVVEPGEAPAAAAARELLEETGYSAGRVVHLGSCSPNPAFMANTFHVFAAEDLSLVAGQSLDEHELVDVEETPEDELLARVGEPPWSHALMMTAAWYYRKWRERSDL
ncbi:MAG: NUDIX hydrolase [Spirochaetae bacterium HGW-Spirochaetae-3]|jgi:8-oxo-dGTP pyrophosphatase MutT (NUDIX family)|nr:MAG: NUDIX hydrolase [Spirochaetae bacterium HGW-Spirochaetae-3]